MSRELTKAERDALDEMQTVCRIWVECDPELRPTPAALSARIAVIANDLEKRGQPEERG